MRTYSQYHWTVDRDLALAGAWRDGQVMSVIAHRLGTSISILYRRVHKLGLAPRHLAPLPRTRWRRPPLYLPRVPTKGPPLIILLFRLMRQQQWSIPGTARRVGLNDSTLREWRRNEGDPKLCNVVACFNSLGFELVVRPKGQKLEPAELRS